MSAGWGFRVCKHENRSLQQAAIIYLESCWQTVPEYTLCLF